MYAVILAGGGGTRLWPLSRPETPKPFLPLLGERSLLQRTVERIVDQPELALSSADVSIVTDRRYAPLVRVQLPGVRVISEPAGRNTAAAVALATLLLERDPDEVMIVLPADHVVAADQEGVFRGVLAHAEAELARQAFEIDSPLVTLGVQVTRPATEYGYLIPDPAIAQGPTFGTSHKLDAHQLRAFEEKPNASRAAELLDEPGVAWNAGIFLWRRRAIRDALERASGLVTLLEPVLRSETGLMAAYDQLRPISIDRAVMESAARDHRVVMGSMDVGWSDLGSWTELLAAVGAGGRGRVVQPNEAADAAADDLVIERINGRIVLSEGPRGILGANPSALLVGSAPHRGPVESLVGRVDAWESRS